MCIRDRYMGMIVFAVMTFIITALVMCFKSEKSRIDDSEDENLVGIYRTLFCGTISNSNMVILMLFIFTRNWFYVPTTATNNFRLIRKGLKKERISEYIFWTFPFTTLFGIFLPTFGVKIGREIKGLMVAALLFFVETFLWYRTIGLFEKGEMSESELKYNYIAVHMLGSMVGCLQVVTLNTLTSRLADLRATATFITALHAINNAGTMVCTTTTFLLISMMTPTSLIHCSWIYGLIYWSLGSRSFLEIEKMNRTQFVITADKKEN
eukprot:TRINITY_DN9990_c0_g1_i1.p1 TRINITY_DN9990_c0_g1~~TRINITY_DN9990_c0_g1_i1.p1  ORF type:complete len:266 (-),score=36.62 TRINITY_DN9990_c0_g1_i1:47-844(-)